MRRNKFGHSDGRTRPFVATKCWVRLSEDFGSKRAVPWESTLELANERRKMSAYCGNDILLKKFWDGK